MFRFLRIIHAFFLIKKGKKGREELTQDLSFGPIEDIFFVSFFILGLLIGGLFYLSYVNESSIALFFAILLILAVIVDIWIYLAIKHFVTGATKKALNFTENRAQRFFSRFSGVVDVEEIMEEKERSKTSRGEN